MKTFLALLLALCVTTACFANPVTFIYTGRMGSGTIGTTSFTNIPFSILARGNTADRVEVDSGVFTIPHGTAELTLEGVGIFSILSPTRTYVNQGILSAGFSRGVTTGSDLFSPFNAPLLATWDMLTSLGPITDLTALLQWTPPFSPLQTTGGDLIFNTQLDIPGTFQAIVTPEPSAILLAVGLPVLLVRRATSSWGRKRDRFNSVRHDV